jgi:hypothetical protein
MTQGCKRRRRLFLTSGMAFLLFAVACRAPVKPQPDDVATAPAGEPETYTALIVRSIEDGQRLEVTETRVMRSGDMRREEWLEQGERRALILRYDTGKRFLLNLDKQIYVESDLGTNGAQTSLEKAQIRNPGSPPPASDSEKPEADANRQTSVMDFVEDNFSEEPTRVETHVLPDETVANQLCKVVERRMTFADGRTEIVKLFRSESLSGLLMRTEMESLSPHDGLKVTTEWRDLKLEVSADTFTVPAHFKKVQRLPAP